MSDTNRPPTERIGDDEVSKRFSDGAVIVRTQRLPWMPWAAPGTYCKVLHMDMSHAKTTLMIKVDPNTPLGEHQHLGDAEAYLLEGDFVYEHGGGAAGDYLCEQGGIAHVPKTGDKGLVLFGMNYGTLHGFDEKGQLAGVIDNAFYYGIAEQHGLHGHLPASARTRNLIGATA